MLSDVPKNLNSNSLNFTKIMFEFTKQLKNIGTNIEFVASNDRADSYAKILQKAGYTLGKYSGYTQFWLANPIKDYQTQNNPYQSKQSFTQRKIDRKNTTIPDSFDGY